MRRGKDTPTDRGSELSGLDRLLSREAIEEYAARIGRLSDRERRRLLHRSTRASRRSRPAPQPTWRRRIAVSAIVLYEWLRGPRRKPELLAQADLFPPDDAIAFDHQMAARAAGLYHRVRPPRGREVDLAIAACGLARPRFGR
jgi:hypothetical protein